MNDNFCEFSVVYIEFAWLFARGGAYVKRTEIQTCQATTEIRPVPVLERARGNRISL